MKPHSAARRLARAADASEAGRILDRALRNSASPAAIVDAAIELAAKDPAAGLAIARWWRAFRSHTRDDGQAYRLKSLGARIRGRWLQAAEDSMQAARSTRDHRTRALLLIGAVDALARGGEAARAISLGRRLLRRLEQSGDRALLARLRLNLGNALLWQDRYEEAKVEYSHAIPTLAQQSVLLAAAAQLGLAACELYGGDPLQAREAADLAERGFRNAGATFYAQLAAVNRWQAEAMAGRPDRALNRLRDLLEALEGSSEPDAARVEEFLADLLLRLNLVEEAAETYRSALRRRAIRNLPLNHANCAYGLGLAELALGEIAAAMRSLNRARKKYHEIGNLPWEAASCIALAQAARRKGDIAGAKQYAQTALRLLRRSPSPLFEFRAHLLLAELSGSRQALERAKRLAQRRSFVQDRWLLEWLLARFSEQPLKHYRRMLDAILESRAALSSTVAKAAFLRDKEAALREYLDWLLQTGRPRDVQEALSVVRRSRSIALLDEILAGGAHLRPEAVARLQKLRAQLAKQSASGKGTRGTGLAVPPSVSRELVAVLAEAETGLSTAPPARAECSVLVAGRERCYWIRGNEAHACGYTEAELTESLDWLLFDLAQPAVAPDVEAGRVLQRAADFARAIGWQRGWTAVAPTGRFWNVPWSLLSAVVGGEEVIVLPSPAFSPNAASSRLPRKPRVCIWIARTNDLPGACREVEKLQRMFPDAVVCASRVETERMLDRGVFDLLHLVGHATARRENPMFSWIEFDDGILLAAEIANSGFRVGCAVLATCDSGRTSLWTAEEPDGLTRAFLARGAAWTLSSQWQLDDLAGEAFSDSFYSALLSGEAVKDAVLRARSAVRARFHHPYYYAPLYLTGGYRAESRVILNKGVAR